MEIIAHCCAGKQFVKGAHCDALRFSWNNAAIRRTVRLHFLQLAFSRDNISRATYPAATPEVRAAMNGERMLPIVTWVVPASLAPLCLPCAGQQRSREFVSADPESTP